MRDEIRALMAEAEAILAGRPSEGSPSEGSSSEGTASAEPAAGRAWVSILAHADWVALTELENRFPLDGGSLWDDALVYLASELLAVAGTPERLFEVQRAALIPLELDLLAGTCQVPATALALVILVRPELARIRSRRAHPSAGRSLPG
jgi:hypothetical protein